VTLGDAVGLAGLALAWFVYQLQRADDRRHERDAALAELRTAYETITTPLARSYFATGYTDQSALGRAQQDYDWIMDKSYGQVFPFATDSLAALIRSPSAGSLIEAETMRTVGLAVWQMGVFNDLVRQKTDFNALHLVELANANLPDSRWTELAEAAKAQSAMLHRHGVGDGEWYSELKCDLEQNIRALGARRPWWITVPVGIAGALVIAALIAVALTALV
jgi:hypothetical protein